MTDEADRTPLRILHIVASYKPAYVYGGPIYSVSALCEGLAHANHQVDVFTTDAAGESELDIELNSVHHVDGVNVIYFHRITRDHSQFTPSLVMHLIRRWQEYDVIHIHSWWNLVSVLAALVCRMKGAPVVISPRGTMGDYAFTRSKSSIKGVFHSYIGKAILKPFTFHVTSEKEKSEVQQRVSPERIVKIPNILSFPDLLSEVKRESIGSAPGRIKLVYIGRIHHKKNLELLFEIMSDERTPECTLDVIGEGEADYIRFLKERSADLTQRVRWLGGVYGDQKFELIKGADALVLLSHSENFANVVVEALSQGVPVIVSPQVGMSEFVVEYDLGWVVDLGKEEGIHALQSLAEDKAKCSRIRQEAPVIIAENFGAKALINRYEIMYKTINTN